MNLSEFKAYVKRDLKREDKDTEIVQAYNDMIFWLMTKMPSGNYKFQKYVTTTSGVEDYELPCDMIHLMHPIKLILGSGATDSGVPLTRLSKEEYDVIEPNPNRATPTLGRPSGYCIYSRSILLTPVPDASDYILELNVTIRPAALSLDAESPAVHAEWDEVLKQGVLERVYAGMGMIEESKFWGDKYHFVNQNNGIDMPVGMCATLFDIEKDREEPAVGQVKFNDL